MSQFKMEELHKNPKEYIGKEFELIEDYLGFKKGTKFIFDGVLRWDYSNETLYSIKKNNTLFTCPIKVFNDYFKLVEEKVNDDLIDKEIKYLRNKIEELKKLKLTQYDNLLNYKGCFFDNCSGFYKQILKINSDILDCIDLTVLYYTPINNNVFLKDAKYNLKSFFEDVEKLDKNILEIIKGKQ